MANPDPTATSPALTIRLPEEAREFLQRVLWDVRDGIRDELRQGRDQVEALPQLRRDEIAYDSLLIAIASGFIVPDAATTEVLTSLAQSIDAGNEYDRVAAEHAALLVLREQIVGGGPND